MKALYRWIEEKAQSGMDAGMLSERLTMLGMEVEECHKRGGVIEGLMVGEVLTCEDHPDSDHLHVCRVLVGGEENTIVCGAENVRAKIKVVVATIGTTLPGDFKIKKAKIRGVESRGMICSKEELGLEEKSKGIWILPDDTKTGPAGPEILGEEDWLMALAVTSNRSDCLSINGLAREAAAAAGKKYCPSRPVLAEKADVSAPAIRIDAPELCGRYSSRLVRGVKIGPSPDWMVSRLEACGMRSINNIVDVTNYVLLEYGHPLHAFDLAKLEGGQIIVRRALDGEVLQTLDGQERKLDATMLVIADTLRPVALAGVMGGANSEVSDGTTDILLESAWFDPVSIRRTSKKTGLSTEASYRFERTADYGGCLDALDRAVELIVKTAGGKPGPVTDVQARPVEPVEISLDYSFVEERLGFAPPIGDARKILANLGFIVAGNGNQLSLTVPTWRSDVRLAADIVEEVARHYGYDRMPARLFPIRVNDELFAASDMTKRMLQDALVSMGLTEALNFNFVLESDLAAMQIDPQSCVTVSNPMSADQKYLRPGLLPNLIANVRTNLGRGVRDIALFEIGKTFVHGDSAPEERLSLGIILSGKAVSSNWIEPGGREYDFFDIKGMAEAVLARLGMTDLSWERNSGSAWHPGRSAMIKNEGTPIGRIGELHPARCKVLDIHQRVVMMEIDTVGRMHGRGEGGTVVEPSRFPSLLRDLAFVVPEDVQSGALMSTIRKAARHLEMLRLVSVWRGEQIGIGNKSLAFSLEFVCREKTLADDEIESIVQNVIKEAGARHGARLR
ncbi:MAG TPA: phenylalanine--tRNA ligase subunit beta [Spirochaetota bacterium]|nr:phenylalanine--tRNA ligase subunit beta [Spirochaetota bacterium]